MEKVPKITTNVDYKIQIKSAWFLRPVKCWKLVDLNFLRIKNLNMLIIFLYSVVAILKKRLDIQFTHQKLIIFITETVELFSAKIKVDSVETDSIEIFPS